MQIRRYPFVISDVLQIHKTLPGAKPFNIYHLSLNEEIIAHANLPRTTYDASTTTSLEMS